MNEYGYQPKGIGESTRETGMPVLGAGNALPTVEEQRADDDARRAELSVRLADSVLGIDSPYVASRYDEEDEIEIDPAGTYEVVLKPGDIGYNSTLDSVSEDTYHIPGSNQAGSAGSR